jgi:hypothetical protein
MVRKGATRSVTRKKAPTKSAKAKTVRVGTKRVRVRTVNAPKAW